VLRDRETESRQIDRHRQTNRQTDRQIKLQIDKQADTLISKEAYERTDIYCGTDIYSGRYTDRQLTCR
jgi:hypothetical protein